jgi:hypothetical protein
MKKSNIYITNCGSVIKLSNKTLSHLEAHPKIIDYLSEAISKTSIPIKQKDRIRIEIDLKKIVGKSSLINTEPITNNSDTYFSIRKGREGPSRVVLDEQQKETSIISVVLDPIVDKQYSLISAWYGHNAPREPWDNSLLKYRKALDESLSFWCCHAIVYEVDFMEEPFISTWKKVISSI